MSHTLTVHSTSLRAAVCAVLLFAIAGTSCGSNGGDPGSARSAARASTESGPCSWLTEAEVQRAVGTDVAPGEFDSVANMCSYQFFSRSGVNTDLVVGRFENQFPESDLLRGRRRLVVSGLGDRAVFYRANTLDDGNSVLILTKSNQSFVLGGEFLTLNAARSLARIVLRSAA
jgi:hypothetical protein